jgi:phosphoribosylformylglycinamidine (FGAM) synthase-like enzyme
MSFHNNVGIDAKIDEEAFDITLFNENLAIIIEVNNKNVAEAQKILETNNIPFDIIGATSSKETIIVNNKVNLSIKEAKNVWDISLREKLLS